MKTRIIHQTGSLTGIKARVKLIDADGDMLGVASSAVNLWYIKDDGTKVDLDPSGVSWTERGNGRYDFTMPDAPYSSLGEIEINGGVTDGTLIGEIHRVVAYNPDLVAVGAATPADVTAAKDQVIAAVNDIDVDLQPVLDAIENIPAPTDPRGPGGIPYPITITKDGQPVDGAAVWITTDIEGTNIIAGKLYTDTFGKINPPFMLEVGTHYVWVQKAGVNFPNPTEITVTQP